VQRGVACRRRAGVSNAPGCDYLSSRVKKVCIEEDREVKFAYPLIKTMITYFC